MIKAYVLANCVMGHERCIIDELKTIPGVREAHGILGVYDVVAEIEAVSREELQRIIVMRIRKINMIRSTLTLIGLEGHTYSTYEI